MIKNFYDNFVLKYPIYVLVALLLAIGTLGYYSTKLEIDASAETLLLDDDKDLKFTRAVNKRYYNPNFLVITYSPNDELLSKTSLETLSKLSKDLLEVESIESITSILNVPLLQSPIRPISDLIDGVDTLETGKFDMNSYNFMQETVKKFPNSKAAIEFKEFLEMIVSEDFEKTEKVIEFFDEKFR